MTITQPSASTQPVAPPALLTGNAQDLEQRRETATQKPTHSLQVFGQLQSPAFGRLSQDLTVEPQQFTSTLVGEPSGEQLPRTRLKRSNAVRYNELEVHFSPPQGASPSEAPAVQALSSPFKRSNARRDFERNLLPSLAQAPAQSSVKVALDGNGRPNFSGQASFQAQQSRATGDLLQRALGPGFQAADSHDNGQDHLLLDAQGHLLQLKHRPDALVLLRTSQPIPDAAGTAQLKLEGDAVQVTVNDQPLLAQGTIGRAHLGHLAGIHQDGDGQLVRLQGQQLYEFDAFSGAWALPVDSESLQFRQLACQGDGRVYGQLDEVLVDLSSPGMPKIGIPQLGAFAVGSDHHGVALCGEHKQSLQLFDFNQDPPHAAPAISLELNGGLAQPASVGLSQGRLFVTDTEGRLYSVGRDQLSPPSLRLMPEEHFHPEGERLGGAYRASGFLSGDDGRLHVLLSDRHGQSHAYLLDEPSQRLKEGWNLSNALVVENRHGLPSSMPPVPANTFDLERQGRIGISEQRIQHWDAARQDWQDTGIQHVELLQRGLDGKAYLVQEGVLRRLDVSAGQHTMTFASSPSLHPMPRAGQVATGPAVAGLEGQLISAFAMVNDKCFVVLDNDHHLTAHLAGGKPSNVSLAGLEGEVASLALDATANLYALNTQGKLFVMAKDDWQAGHADAHWSVAPLPNGRHLGSIRTGDDNQLSGTLKNGEDQGQVQLERDAWQPLAPRPAEQNALNELFDRVRGGVKTAQLPGTSLTARVLFNVAGRAGMESGNAVSASDFIRAHIFKPTLEMPRVLKNIGNYVLHHIQGRQGLRPLYDEQSQLFNRLALEGQQVQPVAALDLQSRIAQLALGPQGKVLQQALEAFRSQLEDSSYQATRHLGQQQGKSSLDAKEGVLNVHGELSKALPRSKLSKRLEQLKERLNIRSSSHNLLNVMQGTLSNLVPSGQNRTGALLKTLQGSGMHVPFQHVAVPLGQRRDASDNQGLTKARLVLDVLTLNDLQQILDKAEGLAEGDDLAQLNAQLSELRDKRYGEHPVKQVTDMGFADHAALEASYDAIKAFLNGFKKEDHAISVNLRAATGSKDQVELAGTLKAALKQLQHPDDEIALRRGYGVNVSNPNISVESLGNGPWPSVVVSGGRQYNLNAERGDKGVVLYLQREGAAAVSVGVGGGKDFWPVLFDADNTKMDIGNNRLMTPAARLGVDLNISAGMIQRDGVVFTVPDGEIDGFVDSLFNGRLNPLQMMKKGFDHEVQKGLRWKFDLKVGASAEGRIGLGMTEDGSSPLSAAARLGVGGTVTVNLLNYSSANLVQSGNGNSTRDISANRPRALNSLDVAGVARAQLNANQMLGESSVSKGVGAGVGVTVAATVENKTSKRIRFTFKQAQPVSATQVQQLSVQLAKAFKDPRSQQMVSALPGGEVLAQLQDLNRHFADKPLDNDEQYVALRALKRASVQQQAAEAGHSLSDGGRFESAYTNLSRLDEQGVVSRIMGLVNAQHSLSNAERVADLLGKDPQLKTLVKQMQASAGTLARVRLELKDEVQDRVDQECRAGTLSQEALAALLGDRNNMRIKAIDLFQSVDKGESFSSPLPVVGYNSSASLNINKTLGKINFSYGRDQNNPQGYGLIGELARPSPEFKAMVGAMSKEGLAFKG